MARPIKHNADYFSHDNNMRNDIKIKAVRRKYNSAGYALYIMILELLTSNEYFEIEWNEDNIELLSPDFDMDTEVITDIVNYCIKLNLLQITNGYLHCETLTDRLEETLLLRRKGYCSNNSKRMSVSGVNVNNNLVNVNIYPQSKVKESKVKESKLKERKVNESIVNESIENQEVKLDKETIAITTKFDKLFSDIN
jgi:hypothetical protein